MAAPRHFRWRRITDPRQENAQLELLDGTTPILALPLPGSGELEVAFAADIGGRSMRLDQLLDLLEEGREVAALYR